MGCVEDPYRIFPKWLWVVLSLVPVLLALVVAIQRDALVPPRGAAVVASLATLPWLVELFGLRPVRWSAATTQLVYAAVVLVAVSVLLVSPAQVDAAPFFLVYLAATASVLAPAWVQRGRHRRVRRAVGDARRRRPVQRRLRLGAGDRLRLGRGGGAGQTGAAHRRVARRAGATGRPGGRRRTAAHRREIHDVIAHSLAVTMLHLTGTRMALHRDPQDAEAALLRAEQLGRQSLAEIRRTVGLLGHEATGVAAPLPCAADIVPLVREFAAAGLVVDLEVSGDADALAPGTGLGLYRIAQESLANVTKHAPGARASVQLNVDDGAARLRVWNEVHAPMRQPADLDRHGICGMQERATLLGGSLRAGPCAEGWSVEASLPRVDELA